MGWRKCTDYRKLNDVTHNDNFALPFIDKILERLAGYEFYCFLYGYSRYNQITIASKDQEKTIFTCHMVLLLLDVCHLVCAMHMPRSKDV